ncbi:hypothetical protein PQ610_01545 [Tardisphaera miroshnichenkoae]
MAAGLLKMKPFHRTAASLVGYGVKAVTLFYLGCTGFSVLSQSL